MDEWFGRTQKRLSNDDVIENYIYNIRFDIASNKNTEWLWEWLTNWKINKYNSDVWFDVTQRKI